MAWHYLLTGEVDEDSATSFMASAWEAHEYDPTQEWYIHINCQGGDVENGSAIYDELHRNSKRGKGTHPITTVIQGKCYSVAAVIAQAGDQRWAGPMSVWMFHEPTSHIDDNINRIQEDVDIMNRWTDHACRIMCERNGWEAADVREKIRNKNWYLTAPDLLASGLIDRIV